MMVSKANDEPMSYRYDVYIDDEPKRTNIPRTQVGRQKTTELLDIPIVFSEDSTNSAHTIKVVVRPSDYDHDSINNVFYKTVYVVPKPKIQAIGLESGSPLANIILNLYKVTTTGELKNIDTKKAIIIDNTHANSFSESEVEILKEYLNEGRGIIVVGGEKSYNYGDYLDSPIEEILPVISKPTDWSGGRNIVLILDMSSSTVAPYQVSASGETLTGIIDESPHDTILANALNILTNENLRDANLGIIAFGKQAIEVSNGMEPLSSASTLERLETKIRQLSPLGDGTALEEGLKLAHERLSLPNSENELIIISDGGNGVSDKEVIELAKSLDNVNIFFIHATSSESELISLAEKFTNEVGGEYVVALPGERIDPDFEKIERPTEENDTSNIGVFPLVELNTKHFITSNVDLDGNITGYNDVTPKAGADRLIITSTGKPVLTTWRYGLGRVAALSTDNGLGADNRWATGMYSGNNSKLLSSTVNWAIGNLREETGAVLEAPDTWYGSPAEIELTMYEEGIPKLKLDGEDVTLSLTGNNVYEAVVSPSPIGVHDLSGYPIAVNYAIEYRDVGLNEELPSTIKAYGGKTYGENEARAQLLEDARQSSQKVVRDTVSQKIYFLLAALILFLGEVVVRRWKEIQEMKKLQNEIQEQ
jgi:hypothetical protein